MTDPVDDPASDARSESAPTAVEQRTAAVSSESAGAAPSHAHARWRTRALGLAAALALLFGVHVVLHNFYLETFTIVTSGMAPTLFAGDRISVRKDAYGRGRRVPSRGDIVAFRNPDEPQHDGFARVIGVPGDTISVQEGAVFINGWRIPTCVIGVAEVEGDGKDHAGIGVVELLGDTAYIVFHDPPAHSHDPEAEAQAHARENEGPYTVPDNEVFVLGDNREHSEDSRHWFEGRGRGVRVDQIKGRASTVWMSSAKVARSRWSRAGLSLTAGPKCPDGFAEATCSALERCLGSPPPREQTTPPEGRPLPTPAPSSPVAH